MFKNEKEKIIFGMACVVFVIVILGICNFNSVSTDTKSYKPNKFVKVVKPTDTVYPSSISHVPTIKNDFQKVIGNGTVTVEKVGDILNVDIVTDKSKDYLTADYQTVLLCADERSINNIKDETKYLNITIDIPDKGAITAKLAMECVEYRGFFERYFSERYVQSKTEDVLLTPNSK